MIARALIAHHAEAHPCEPGFIRSSDGKQIARCAPDGRLFVTIRDTTHGHRIEGQKPFIVSVRLESSEMDARPGRTDR